MYIYMYIQSIKQALMLGLRAVATRAEDRDTR